MSCRSLKGETNSHRLQCSMRSSRLPNQSSDRLRRYESMLSWMTKTRFVCLSKSRMEYWRLVDENPHFGQLVVGGLVSVATSVGHGKWDSSRVSRVPTYRNRCGE